jgi:hypothetical protein
MVTRKYLDSRLTDAAVYFLDYAERFRVAMDILSKRIADVHGDMDILSRRITNGFAYITTVMEEHEAKFHAKPAPKKPGKRRDPKIRKA